MTDNTTTTDKDAPTADEVTTETHVRGVEDAGGRGLITRRQADRLIETGTRAHHAHDLARGLRNSAP